MKNYRACKDKPENDMTFLQKQWLMFMLETVNTGQICMRFKADKSEKLQKYVHLRRVSDKDLV